MVEFRQKRVQQSFQRLVGHSRMSEVVICRLAWRILQFLEMTNIFVSRCSANSGYIAGTFQSRQKKSWPRRFLSRPDGCQMVGGVCFKCPSKKSLMPWSNFTL